jgi:hypothetical protein
MLNKWISDSESKTTPLEMIKSDQQTITAQPTVLSVKRTDGLLFYFLSLSLSTSLMIIINKNFSLSFDCS